MRVRRWLGLAVLFGSLAAVLALSSPAQSQRQRDEDQPLTKRLAREGKVTDEQAARVFNALGPVLRNELGRGRTVSVPGLGTFRVVQIAEHKDIERGTGRVLRVPATNTVEFLADGSLNRAANSDAAVPAETVPAFEYVPLPNQTPGQKSGTSRSTGTRTK